MFPNFTWNQTLQFYGLLRENHSSTVLFLSRSILLFGWDWVCSRHARLLKGDLAFLA